MNPRQTSPRWRGPHLERQPAHQLIEYPSTLIADYGREKKKLNYKSDLIQYRTKIEEQNCTVTTKNLIS